MRPKTCHPHTILRQYRNIGTVSECEEAREKQKPKPVDIEKDPGHSDDCYCPNCGKYLGTDQDWRQNQTNYCSNCGQKLAKYRTEETP